jgi:hypothetical protein
MISLAEALSLTEIDVVKRSLQATVEGRFFPDWEFETLIGVDRETVKDVYEAWPNQTSNQEDFGCAVVGSLNNLLGYPHGRDEELVKYVPEGREAIKAALNHLIALGV